MESKGKKYFKDLFIGVTTGKNKKSFKEIDENAENILKMRYYINLPNGEKETSFSQLCQRVARIVSSVDVKYVDEEDEPFISMVEENIENDMRSHRFLFNSPALFSSGAGISADPELSYLLYDHINYYDRVKLVESYKQEQMLFACFTLEIPDSLEGIFDSVKKAGIISKYGGGVGANFGNLREKNAPIAGGHSGNSSGPVSFMETWNTMGSVVVQGGKRRSALMGMLYSDHPDIEEFINCKTEDGKLNYFNISVAIDDVFMEAVKNDADYELISPKSKKVVKTVKARELWDKICTNAHKRGDPGIFFIDKANDDSWLQGIPSYTIETSNPCGEQPLPNATSCNLGSINLSEFVSEDGEFEIGEFINQIKRAVYYLDLVIDATKYPLPEIEERTKKIRPVGLGVMGLADAVIKMGIKYGSKEFIDFCDTIGELMAKYSLKTSHELAIFKGAFELWDTPEAYYNPKRIIEEIYEGKTDKCFTTAYIFNEFLNYTSSEVLKIEDVLKYGFRNSRRLSIAPTGSISLILNTSSSIEPNFAFEWTRLVSVTESEKKEFIYKHKLNNEKNKDFLISAYDLDAKQHVEVVQTFAKYVDSAISKCVAKGTNIQTNVGVLKIEDFGAEKEVDTFEDVSDKNIMVRDMNGDWKKVLSHYYGGKKKTLKFRFKNGFELECSEEHKLMTIDGWMKAKDITSDMLIEMRNCDYGSAKGNMGIEYTCDEDIMSYRRQNKIKTDQYIRENGLINENIEYDKNNYYVKIDYIEESENEIYDIEVEDTHSYLISGIVSHNTVNLPNDATVEDVKKVYEMCYDHNIKGITIYRDGSRCFQPITTKKEIVEEVAQVKNRPQFMQGVTTKTDSPYGSIYVTANFDDEGKMFETFISAGKSGSVSKSITEALSRVISLALRANVDIHDIIKTISNISGSEIWVYDRLDGTEAVIKSIPDATAKMLEDISNYYLNNVQNVSFNVIKEKIVEAHKVIKEEKHGGEICPECGVTMAMISGCNLCLNCGYSNCK